MLDDIGVTHLGLGGVLAGVPARPALAQEIPALVELHLDLLEACPVLLREPLVSMRSLKLVLLRDETVDLLHDRRIVDVGVVQGFLLIRLSGVVPLVTLAIPERSA